MNSRAYLGYWNRDGSHSCSYNLLVPTPYSLLQQAVTNHVGDKVPLGSY